MLKRGSPQARYRLETQGVLGLVGDATGELARDLADTLQGAGRPLDLDYHAVVLAVERVHVHRGLVFVPKKLLDRILVTTFREGRRVGAGLSEPRAPHRLGHQRDAFSVGPCPASISVPSVVHRRAPTTPRIHEAYHTTSRSEPGGAHLAGSFCVPHTGP